MAVVYTYARGIVQDYYANPFDKAPSWETNNLVLPHRFVWSSVYELLFGKGRRWLSASPARRVAGGWQLSWIYEYQMGAATTWNNLFFYGDLNQIGSLFKHDQTQTSSNFGMVTGQIGNKREIQYNFLFDF
jgi:hypothetical protein